MSETKKEYPSNDAKPVVLYGLTDANNVNAIPILVDATGAIKVSVPGGLIPQYSADPSSPSANSAWVLKTGSGGGTGGGVFKGVLGLGFTYLSANSGGSLTYQLSYRTTEGTTKRVSLT